MQVKIYYSCEIIFSNAATCNLHNVLQHPIKTMVLGDYQNAQMGAFSSSRNRNIGIASRVERWPF